MSLTLARFDLKSIFVRIFTLMKISWGSQQVSVRVCGLERAIER